MYSQKRLQHIVMDSTGAYTAMCHIGKLCRTDKSPYNGVEHGMHRHPYTAVYSTLFAPLKNRDIVFGEIGVAGGASVILWWNYFTKATFYFFDRDQNCLNNIINMKFPKNVPKTGILDVSVDGDIDRAILKTGQKFDILIDDSSHDYAHQIRIVKESWPHIKSGGYMIVEDIFRKTPEGDYERDLDAIIDDCAEAYFVVCNHEERYSPGWNNDKLLVLVKA
jgi:hypothetical protein